MNYSEAIQFIQNNSQLIGTTTERGLKIGKLIIVPVDEINRNQFFSSYFQTNDENSSILPYMNEPLEVWAIDLEYLTRNNVLFYKKLS